MTPRRSAPTLFRRKRRRILPAILAVLLIGGAGAGAYLLLKDDEAPEHHRPRAARAVGRSPEDVRRPAPDPRADREGLRARAVRATSLPSRNRPHSSTPATRRRTGTRRRSRILLYGPGYIKQGVASETEATVADLAPDLRRAPRATTSGPTDRDGKVLEEALLPPEERNGTPKLIFTLVWDGGGDNVLERGRTRGPISKRLKRKATSYENATVGSITVDHTLDPRNDRYRDVPGAARHPRHEDPREGRDGRRMGRDVATTTSYRRHSAIYGMRPTGTCRSSG